MTAIHAATASLVEYALGQTASSPPSDLPPDVERAGLNILLDTLGAMIGARAPGRAEKTSGRLSPLHAAVAHELAYEVVSRDGTLACVIL